MDGDSYSSPKRTPGIISRALPTLAFYLRATSVVVKASGFAKRTGYNPTRWAEDSQAIVDAAESVGCRISIEGLHHFRSVDGPCIIVANHMSTLETFALPSILQPIKDVTFVVKQSLVEYPIFKHVMRGTNPITVTRTNPREDLKKVMEAGSQTLKDGKSIIIFPQTTRSEGFDPAHFNSIGVKLASRAGVPVVPLALYTAFWANGHILKDFGRIYPLRPVRFCFGSPVNIDGKGAREHQVIADFIQGKLSDWAREDGR